LLTEEEHEEKDSDKRAYQSAAMSLGLVEWSATVVAFGLSGRMRQNHQHPAGWK
jgi:hypothetical protein